MQTYTDNSVSKPFQLLKIKSYWFGELAQFYFRNSAPRSAQNQLRRWINLNTALQEELKELYFQPNKQRKLTPRQVECIVRHLGEPGD